MTIKELLNRLYVKLISFKAMFTIAVLVLLSTVQFSPDNANVLKDLIYAVLCAKAVQYAAAAYAGNQVPED
jgi:hypothetical protein